MNIVFFGLCKVSKKLLWTMQGVQKALPDFVTSTNPFVIKVDIKPFMNTMRNCA